MSKARIMYFVGFVALTALAVVCYTRPSTNIWWQNGGWVSLAYALFCLFRVFTWKEPAD